MKAYKKVFALLLALVMTMALAVTAFAVDEKGSITVKNPVDGKTYTAYKIFDVVYNDKKDAYSYTISSDSEWYDTVGAYAGVKLTQSAGQSNVYVVTTTSDFSAAKFAETLRDAAKNMKGGIAMANGKAENLELGYYLVVPKGAEGNAAICNLTTTNPDVSISDKNDVTFDKVDDKSDVQIGDVVNYTITGKVPDTTGFTQYTYEITDTMSDGLTFKKDVAVTVDGKDISGKFDLTNNDKGFTLTLKVMEMQDLVGKDIKVTYSATVNENAVAVVSKNHAQLKYSNDPTDTSKTNTVTDEETVYSAEIVIDKHKTNEENTKLAGAVFVLKNDEGKYYKYEGGKVQWVDAENEATPATTTANGAANFKGLKNGTYSLIETKAPDGYNLLTSPVTVTVNGNDTSVGSLTVTEKVANSTGNTLPSTGGIGTTIFYVVGGLLVVGAAVLLISKKRMSATK